VVGAGFMLRYHLEGFRRAGAGVVAITDATLSVEEREAKIPVDIGSFAP